MSKMSHSGSALYCSRRKPETNWTVSMRMLVFYTYNEDNQNGPDVNLFQNTPFQPD